MTGEGQVVQLRVRAEHDAVRQRIDRAGTGERLRERVALAVSAADVASHDEPLLPMPPVSPPVRPLIEAWSPLVISEAQPLVTILFTRSRLNVTLFALSPVPSMVW